MLVEMVHLREDTSTGILVYRRKFPRHLAAFIPSASPAGRGRTEFKVSLRARNLKEPGAAERLLDAQREYEAIVAAAEKAKTANEKRAAGNFDTLDAPTIAALAARYHAQELDDDDMRRRDPSAKESARVAARVLAKAGFEFPAVPEIAEWTLSIRAAHEAIRGAARSMRAYGDAEGITATWGTQALQLASEQGYELEVGGSSHLYLCEAINDAAVKASEDALARLDGDAVPTPALPPIAAPAATNRTPSAEGDTFDKIAAAIIANPRQGIGASSKQSIATALRFFREAHGTPKPAEITRAMVSGWLDLLSQRPARLPQSERKMPLRDIVQRYAGRDDVPKQSAKTYNGHASTLAAMWNKAVKAGSISDRLPNPFAGQSIKPAVVAKPAPKGFSPAELNAIFSLPIFTIGERPTQGKGDASYWLPLLLLWTGARPEEAAQLLLTDFQDDESGRWTMAYTDQGEHPHKGQRALKTSRHGSGRRTFPVPQALINLGLRDYVDHLQKLGEAALFPLLRTKSDRMLLAAGWNDWWAKLLYERKILVPGQKRQPSREFRHTWTTAARKSGIAREAREYLQGHRAAGGTANEVYGSLEPLGAQIDKLQIAGLDLSSVRRWRP